MSEQTLTLTIPERCGHGHRLTARITYVEHLAASGLRWRCCICQRVTLWRMQFGAGAKIPAEILDPARYRRQQQQPCRVPSSAIVFESGLGFDLPDEGPPSRRRRAAASGERAA